MLLNKARAIAVMEKNGLDGLATQLPINVYYLTDYYSQIMTANFDWSCFAVLPRNDSELAAIVIPALDLRALVTAGTWVPNIVTYTDRPASADTATDGGGIPYGGWPTRPDAPLSDLASQWVSGVSTWCSSPSANGIGGLVRALKEAGLAKGVIGVDDERLVKALPEAGLAEAKVIYRRDVFNEIRIVKSDEEIELLRRAAQINEASVLEAIDAMRVGATWDDLVRIYMTGMARRDGSGVYLACGVGGLPHRKVVENEPVMFDGLGKYKGYHGDFGCSTVVGEPTAELEKRVKALQAGLETAHDMIRPGVSYSDIRERVSDVVRMAGFNGAFRDPVPHSLGLEHTDDPTPLDLPPGLKADRVLEENMVINVDLPHIEIGWGAIHLEDTARVTATGCEALTSMQTDLRIIPA